MLKASPFTSSWSCVHKGQYIGMQHSNCGLVDLWKSGGWSAVDLWMSWWRRFGDFFSRGDGCDMVEMKIEEMLVVILVTDNSSGGDDCDGYGEMVVAIAVVVNW